MKKVILLHAIVFVLIHTASAQFNHAAQIPHTGYNAVADVNRNTAAIYDFKNMAGIPCNTNTFYTVNLFGDIEEFTLNGGVVTSNGVVFNTIPGTSLAIANNLNGGTFNPTFYTTFHDDDPFLYTDSLFYFDGNSWINTGTSYIGKMPNTGGIANYVYTHDFDYRSLKKYNGSSIQHLYYDSTGYFSIADVAVDDLGNAWTLTGTFSASDSIIVISPTGQVVKKYPFVLNTENAYGCMLMNGVFYIAVGDFNSSYPNTLFPVTFSGNNAIMGTPIAMPVNDYVDLASCTPGSPLSVKSSSVSVCSLQIVPNPSTDFVVVSSITGFTKEATLTITDVHGAIVYRNSAITAGAKIQTHHFAAGVYSVRITDGKQKVVKKFVKE